MNKELEQWKQNMYCLSGYTVSTRSGLIHDSESVFRIHGKDKEIVTDPEEKFYVIASCNSQIINGSEIDPFSNKDQWLFKLT